MKTKILVLTLSLLCLNTFAQKKDSLNQALTKGNISLGGNIGGGWGYDRFFGELSPSVGYFIKDKLEVGFQLNNDLSFNKGIRLSHYNLNIALYTRKYFNKGIFLHAEAFAGQGKYYTTIDNDETKLNHQRRNLGVAPGVGYMWFLGRNIAIEGLLKYNLQFTETEDLYPEIHQPNTTFEDHLQFKIGLKFFLGRKEK